MRKPHRIGRIVATLQRVEKGRTRRCIVLCRLQDEIACNGFGVAQYPQHEGANGARQAGKALRQAASANSKATMRFSIRLLSSLAEFQSIATSGQFRR